MPFYTLHVPALQYYIRCSVCTVSPMQCLYQSCSAIYGVVYAQWAGCNAFTSTAVLYTVQCMHREPDAVLVPALQYYIRCSVCTVWMESAYPMNFSHCRQEQKAVQYLGSAVPWPWQCSAVPWPWQCSALTLAVQCLDHGSAVSWSRNNFETIWSNFISTRHDTGYI